MKKTIKPLIGLFLAGIIIFIFWWVNSHRLDDYIQNPKVNDIYIMHADELYAPFKIIEIDKNQIWTVYYYYNFTDAVPDRNQILEEEFDLSAHFIYEKQDLIKMYQEGRIVEIYRD